MRIELEISIKIPIWVEIANANALILERTKKELGLKHIHGQFKMVRLIEIGSSQCYATKLLLKLCIGAAPKLDKLASDYKN